MTIDDARRNRGTQGRAHPAIRIMSPGSVDIFDPFRWLAGLDTPLDLDRDRADTQEGNTDEDKGDRPA